MQNIGTACKQTNARRSPRGLEKRKMWATHKEGSGIERNTNFHLGKLKTKQPHEKKLWGCIVG